MIELNQNLRCLFPDYRLPSFAEKGRCRASRSARTDFFLQILSLKRFFFRVCASFSFRHSCNHFETVVTSKQNFYLLFSRYKKSPNSLARRGLFKYTLIRTSENVSMQSYYSNTSTSRKSLEGLSRCKIH